MTAQEHLLPRLLLTLGKTDRHDFDTNGGTRIEISNSRDNLNLRRTSGTPHEIPSPQHVGGFVSAILHQHWMTIH